VGIGSAGAREGGVALLHVVDRPAALPTADVYFTPELYLETPGATFTVTIAIQGAVQLGGFQFDLIYDPAVLRADSAVMGAFLASTGRSVAAVGPEINQTTGMLRFGAFSFGSVPGPGGNGALTQVRFTAVANGATRLNLANVKIVESNLTPQEQPANALTALASVGAALQAIEPLAISQNHGRHTAELAARHSHSSDLRGLARPQSLPGTRWTWRRKESPPDTDRGQPDMG